MGFGGHINENIWRVFSRQRWEFMVEILEVMSLIPFMVCDVHVKFLVVGVGHMGEAEKWKTLQRKVL